MSKKLMEPACVRYVHTRMEDFLRELRWNREQITSPLLWSTWLLRPAGDERAAAWITISVQLATPAPRHGRRPMPVYLEFERSLWPIEGVSIEEAIVAGIQGQRYVRQVAQWVAPLGLSLAAGRFLLAVEPGPLGIVAADEPPPPIRTTPADPSDDEAADITREIRLVPEEVQS